MAWGVIRDYKSLTRYPIREAPALDKYLPKADARLEFCSLGAYLDEREQVYP